MIGIAASRDLPLEVSRQPLDFARLTAVLRTLDGTRVIVSSDPGPGDDGRPAALTAVGVLRERGQTTGSGRLEFGVGEPECAGGGVLRLMAPDVRAATLSTFDGNDFFIVRIRLRGGEIRMQDEDSGSP